MNETKLEEIIGDVVDEKLNGINNIKNKNDLKYIINTEIQPDDI